LPGTRSRRYRVRGSRTVPQDRWRDHAEEGGAVVSTDAETAPAEEGRALVSAATETGSVDTRPMAEARRRELALLVEQAQAGSRSALDEIVERLMPLVWQVVLSQGADRDTAMDVVQSTWLSMVEHLAELRNPAALAAWLVAVARREAQRAVRLKRRTYVVEPDGALH